MMKRIRFLRLAVLVTAALVLATGWGGKPAQADFRILLETEDYHLAKYEPVSGAYLGAYVYQDTMIQGNMHQFNQLTGKKHASFFLYVGYGRPVPEQWLQDVRGEGAFAHIAWEPNHGLDEVQDNDYLRSFAAQLGATEMPIFLRFASEMNGSWSAYSGDPQKYIEKWRLVHQVMREEAPNVMMVWTVFTFPQSTILQYYPGDDYVDWVGVNIYNVVYHNDDLQQPAAHEDPLELLDYVYDQFSARKPIQISEYGVTHYTVTDGKEYIDFAINRLSRLYRNLPTKYPRVKSIYYFNVNNLVNAPEGRKINNYALTDNHRILNAYATVVNDPHFLSEAAANLTGQRNKEYLHVSKPVHVAEGRVFVPAADLERAWGCQITLSAEGQLVKINKAGEISLLPVTVKPIYRGQNRELYLPLRAVAEHMGYRLSVDEANRLIKVQAP